MRTQVRVVLIRELYQRNIPTASGLTLTQWTISVRIDGKILRESISSEFKYVLIVIMFLNQYHADYS